MRRSDRSAVFPQYIPERLPQRNILYLEGSEIYNKDGEAHKLSSCDDLISHLFTKNGLCFVQSLVNPNSFPYLDALLSLRNCSILSTKKGIPLSARIHTRYGSRWIVQLDAWERNSDNIFELRNTFDHVGLGTKPTYGSLGAHTQRVKWGQYGLPCHTEPGKLARDFLYLHHVGGRCDTPGIHNIYNTAIELDMASAYLAHSLYLPTGTTMKFSQNDTSLFATWFAEVKVTIHKPLPLGPFPYRVPGKSKRLSYPSEPGTYHTYLWKEEIEDCLRAGCTMETMRGYGWRFITEDMSNWARWIYYKKIMSPNDVIEKDMKQTIVSAFGHFGMRGLFYTLINEEEAMRGQDRGLPIVFAEDGPYPYFVQENHDYNSPQMIHWIEYIKMQCRRTLYQMALPYAIAGTLIATNYDAIFVVETDESRRYKRKYTIEAKMAEMGDLRWTRLLQFNCVASRSYDCLVEYPDGRIVPRHIRPGKKVVA